MERTAKTVAYEMTVGGWGGGRCVDVLCLHLVSG